MMKDINKQIIKDWSDGVVRELVKDNDVTNVKKSSYIMRR